MHTAFTIELFLTTRSRRYEHSAPVQKNVESWEKNDTAIAETVSFVSQLAQRYGSRAALLGISLLNEPTVREIDLCET